MADLAKQTSEAFGDIEFEASLGEFLDKDPVAALGFDPAKIKFNVPQGDKYGTKYLREEDVIRYGPDTGSSKDIIIHEFRHRGHQLLRNEIEKNPQAFVEKYGQDVVDFLVGEFDKAKATSQKRLVGMLYSGDRHEEFRTELGDNLEATFVKPRPTREQFLEQMKDAMGDSADLFTEAELVDLGVKNYIQNVDNTGYLKDKTELVTKEDQEKYKDILTKVRQAASDLLEKRRGYDEGGVVSNFMDMITSPLTGDYRKNTPLSVQMADIGVDVATPLGTITDIQTELEKEKPNYAMIAGMAGLELLGPAAGAVQMAAKSGNKGLLQKILGSLKSKKNDNLFDDDGYNPVIMGDEDDYNPITDSKPSVVTDDDVAQEIRQMELDKKNYDFLDEIAIQQAYDAGVLNPEEWVDQTKALFKKQIKNMNTGGVEYDQKNLFIKAAESIGAENLVDLVKNKPTDPKGKTMWGQKVSNYADQANLTYNQMLSALSGVQDSTRVHKAELTEKPLPIAAETGEVYPTKPFQEQYPVRTAEQRALDEKASKLGFKDTVYHTTRAQSQESYPFGEEFTEFKLPDQLAGKNPFTAAALHDLLGVHVGTARAAAERSEGYGGTGKFTMELRAKLDKPAEIEDLSEILGLEKDYRPFDNEFIPSEADLRTAINRESENLFGLKAFYTRDQELKAVKSLRQKLAKKGYTHIPYVNDVEDKESISYIMLVDRPKGSPAVLRDFRAKFDPEQRANPDLRMNEGGIIPEPTPLASDLARAKSKKRLEAADRLGYFIPPEIKDVGRRAFGLAEALDPAQGILRGMSATGRAFDQDLPTSSRRQAAIEASLETLAPLGLVFLGKLAKDPAQKVLMDVLTPTGAPSSTADGVTFDPGRRKFLKQSLAAGTTAAVAPDILSDIIPKTTKAATKVASGIDAAVAKLVKMRKDSSLLIRAGLDIETDLRIKTGTPLPPKDNTLLLDPEYSDALKKEDEIRKKFVEDGSQKTVDDLYAEANKLGIAADRFAENILKTVSENPEALSSLDNQTVEDLIGSFNVDMLAPGSDMDYFPKAYEDVVKEAIRRGMHEDWEKYPMTELASEYILEDLVTSGSYNKGGLSMNQQMELFARGGLKDDGMDMDPVSGNEVPSGSLAEEVRDDIPAQLSEGEYVVPADVVRYYGVKFFEDLRADAKMGLQQMEADGRIGGEPVMDQGITEEDLAALDQMLTTGAYNGGLMDKLEYAAKNDPVVNQRLNQGGMVVSFAEGGMTQSLYSDPTQIDMVINKVMAAARQNPEIMEQLSARGIQINRTEPQMPPQQMNQANPPQEARQAMAVGGPVVPMPTVPGYGASEEQMYNYITSPTTVNPIYSVPGASYSYAEDGALPTPKPQQPIASPEYCNSIGMMFDPTTNACVPKPQVQTSTDDDDSGPMPTGDGKPAFEDWGQDLDFTNYEYMEKWAKGLSEPMKGGKFLQGAGVLAGGPAALLLGGAPSADALKDISDLRAAQIIAEARGDTKTAEMLAGYVDERIKSSNKIVDFLDDLVASGKQKADAYAKTLGYKDMADATSKENIDRFKSKGDMMSSRYIDAPTVREMNREETVMSQQVKPPSANNDDDSPTHAEIMEAHYGTGWSDTQTDEQEEASDVGFGSDTGGWTPEGFDFGQNRGGLIKRRK